MDERIQQLEQDLTEQTERLRAAIDQLRQDWTTAQEAEALREQVGALTERTAALEAQVERLRAEGERLRQGIVRYAIACGTVDLKTALMRRTPNPDAEVRADVQRAIEEEQAASEALRQLARQLPPTPTPPAPA